MDIRFERVEESSEYGVCLVFRIDGDEYRIAHSKRVTSEIRGIYPERVDVERFNSSTGQWVQVEYWTEDLSKTVI